MELIINPSRSEWPRLCARPSDDNAVVRERVAAILERVRTQGDEALKALSREIDGVTLESLEVSEAEFTQADALVGGDVKRAIARAAANIRAFHEAQRPRTVDLETQEGVRCLQRAVPIRRVGLYIPGGSAPLFSTVLMLAIPAKVAGCPEIILCTPVSKATGRVAPEVLYAARFCGVDRVFKAGGAQAVAAMAYGTGSIPAVDKIFGPGNQYVTTAKQLLGGKTVAIDMPAGPSEVMVLADRTARKECVAADLLSQADGAEHLILSVRDPWEIADRITCAGSVFVGPWSPESAGDYASGTNHTLPTSGWARAFNGVNLDSFVRKITFQELTKDGLEALAPTITALAEAEGLRAHANAVTIRLQDE